MKADEIFLFKKDFWNEPTMLKCGTNLWVDVVQGVDDLQGEIVGHFVAERIFAWNTKSQSIY